MENTGIGLGDAMLLAQNGGTGCNGGGWFLWVILLFFLMGGNGGWGNNRNYATTNDVYAAADNQNMENSIRDIARQINQIGDGISSATYALNNTVQNGFTGVMRDQFNMQTAMLGGFNNVGQAISENRFANQQGFCTTNYNNAMNTANITQAIHNEGEETRKLIVANQLTDLQARLAERDRELQTAQFALSQQAQNAAIIGAVRPFPQPSYIVGSPYGTGCNCGCGVN